MTRTRGIIKPSEIETAYVGLWTRFNAACTAAKVKCAKKDGKGIKQTKTGTDTVSFHSFFYLPSWPYRSARTSETVDILVQSTEEVDCKRSAIVKSTVQVVYFETSSTSRAKVLLGLHYDFQKHTCSAHPVFHVQLGDTKFDPDDCLSVGFRKSIETGSAKLYGKVRIPTPHMSLCAVLLTLAADHLPEREYKSFLSDLKKCDLLKLHVACEAMQDSIGETGDHWSSLHWYS